MDTITIVFLVLSILGILLTIYYGIKSRRLRNANTYLNRLLVDCKNKCSNVCNVNVHK